LESTCSIDIKFFPFDTQRCDFKFTAWSYRKDDVVMDIGTDGIDLRDYIPNSQWDVVGTSKNDVDTDESAVIFTVIIKRKPLFYLLNVVCPVIMLSLLMVFTFVLPISSGERAGYCITVFLSLAVFLTIVASQMPKNSEQTSALAIYMLVMTILSTLIVIITLCEVRLSTRTLPEDRINGFYRFTYKLSMCLRCKSCCKGKNQVEILNKETSSPATWMEVVNGLDFLLFWLFILTTFALTAAAIPIAASGASP